MFTNENQGINSYLVYTLEPADELDQVTLGMMTNNEIAGLSPIIFNQMNDQKICRFNITAKQTLANFLSRPVRRQQFLTILGNMMNTIRNLDSYLIPEEALLYDTNAIYIDIRTMEVRMICLPVVVENQRTDLQNFFRNLIFTTNYVQTENCDYVARLINFFNSMPGFDVQACLELIHTLMRNEAAQPAVMVPGSQMETERQNIKKEEVVAGQEQRPVQQQASSVQRQTAPVQRQAAPVQRQTAPVQRQTTPVQPPIQAKQEEKKKGFNLFGRKKDKYAQDSAGIAVPGQMPQGQRYVQPPMQGTQKPVQTPPPARQQPPVQTVEPVRQQQYDFGNTTVLSSGSAGLGETTVLSSSVAKPKPYLFRLKNGERITVDKPRFRIGREKSYVDYFISDNSTISCNHAEIVTEHENYFIIDTNSTNHTYVNGAMITSGEQVRIENGTRIRLADEEFEFRYF